ncbi:imm11 family protein [Blastopirellula marina]|uniref:Immunity MXAN-0049 protein domain-containing protein n=1 Tax=Blastopirellula marina TaxID=124 RepID=A0A2S8GEP7_9BACT|nr:hypothetical protein [Blastopirellula marina]PQO42927.1 hypothetical protein C5Y93_24700 [Blastopirellula marina]
MTQKVFWIRESLEDDRPSGVTYHDPNGEFKSTEGFKRFQANSQVSAGTVGFPKDRWFSPVLSVSEPGTSPIGEWDYFMCSGTFGAFSERAVQVLMPFWKKSFELLPATLEGLAYSCLRCSERTDCLDETQSEITYFDGTTDVMEINSYVFKKELLANPMIFSIPQLTFELFATESIPRLAFEAGLRGFDFEQVDK